MEKTFISFVYNMQHRCQSIRTWAIIIKNTGTKQLAFRSTVTDLQVKNFGVFCVHFTRITLWTNVRILSFSDI